MTHACQRSKGAQTVGCTLSILGASETGLEQPLQKAFSNADDDGWLVALQPFCMSVGICMQSKLTANWVAWVDAALVCSKMCCNLLLPCTGGLLADPVSGVVQVEFKSSAHYDMTCHSPKADRDSKV